ncbi:hypothetical protein GCM10027180_01750 [Microbulbifer echini]
MRISNNFIFFTLFLTFTYNAESQTDIGAVKFETLVASSKDWEGHKLPEMRPGQQELTIVRVTIPPGKQMPVHKHPVLNGVYIEKGTLTIVLPGQKETLTLGEGKAFIEVTNKWHYGRNDGKDPVIIVLFYSGPEGEPTTIFKNPDEKLQ